MSPKALFIDNPFNGPWRVGSKTSIQKPAAGELLVKIYATALNPVDWKVRQNNAYVTEYPAIIGTDAAGVVEETGEGVMAFVKGDRV